jgi:hypothetical protein
MAVRELFYADQGPAIFEDTDVSRYDDGRQTRGARTSQAYIEDAPVDDLEIVRKIDLTSGGMAGWDRLFMLMGA